MQLVLPIRIVGCERAYSDQALVQALYMQELIKTSGQVRTAGKLLSHFSDTKREALGD